MKRVIDLYDVVADMIKVFCKTTYYGDTIASFDISYDGIEWSHEVVFASFENGDFETVVFNTDWCEGQTIIRNPKIWHLEDSGPIVRCGECKWANSRDECAYNGKEAEDIKMCYCSYGERRNASD